MHSGTRTATKKRAQRGFTLLEMIIASAVLIIGIVGMLSLVGVAIARNAGNGDQATRAAEYAQDKMEQLMALEFTDLNSDTRMFPTVSSGGTGLTAGGGVTPGTPVASYVDYGPDDTGKFSSTSKPGCYTRQWLIEDVTSISGQTIGSGRVKRITVLVIPPKGMMAPPIMLASLKARQDVAP